MPPVRHVPPPCTRRKCTQRDQRRQLGVPSLDAAGPLASFGLAENLGYGDQISNRVVDAIGDVAGGVHDPVLDKPEV